MRAEVESESGKRSRPVSWAEQHRGQIASDGTNTPAEDDQAEWARQEQQVGALTAPRKAKTHSRGQMMIRQQDQTIDSISGTLNTLAQQAGLMGQEIGEHNE